MDEQKQTIETDVKLSWLTRIAMMLGLGSDSHARTTAERREKVEKDLEEYMRGKLPPVLQGGDVLPLVFYPNPILREVSQHVTGFDADFAQLVQSLGATMYLCGGVGLSAVQVGVPLRVFVADLRDRDDPEAPGDFHIYVNPTVTFYGADKAIDIEGCLSMPNIRESIQRPTQIKIFAQDTKGKPREEELEGWAARVVLHEMEHLDGHIFIDALGPMQKRMVEKRIAKLRRSFAIDEENGKRRAQRKLAKGRGR